MKSKSKVQRAPQPVIKIDYGPVGPVDRIVAADHAISRAALEDALRRANAKIAALETAAEDRSKLHGYQRTLDAIEVDVFSKRAEVLRRTFDAAIEVLRPTGRAALADVLSDSLRVHEQNIANNAYEARRRARIEYESAGPATQKEGV